MPSEPNPITVISTWDPHNKYYIPMVHGSTRDEAQTNLQLWAEKNPDLWAQSGRKYIVNETHRYLPVTEPSTSPPGAHIKYCFATMTLHCEHCGKQHTLQDLYAKDLQDGLERFQLLHGDCQAVTLQSETATTLYLENLDLTSLILRARLALLQAQRQQLTPEGYAALAHLMDRFDPDTQYTTHTPDGVQISRDGAIHEYFSLSYANYLLLERTLLQSMPLKWQRHFVDLLQVFNEAFNHLQRAPGWKIEPVIWKTPEDFDRKELKKHGLTAQKTMGKTLYFDADGNEYESWESCVPIPTEDPIPHYNRGRTFIAPQLPENWAKNTTSAATPSTTIQVRHCSACGLSHPINITPLPEPKDEYTHFGVCTSTQRRILVTFTGDQL